MAQNRFLLFVLALLAVIVLALFLFSQYLSPEPVHDTSTNSTADRNVNRTNGTPKDIAIGGNLEIGKPETLATELEVPWDIAFLPDGDLLVTERPGRLRRIGSNPATITVEGVRQGGEGGLLGIALHPSFEGNNWIYLYFTTETSGKRENRVKGYRFDVEENTLSEKTAIIEGIPASQNHNGGRIRFGPDSMLYITTGDAGDGDASQDTNSLAGKILRIKDDGGIPEDNPFSNAVYSYGHRNVQGIAWDSEGRLWATEHGRSGALSGYDELNLIEKGKNYGWPEIEGDETREGIVSPTVHSGATTTWAPSGAAYANWRIFFVGLRGEALYEYDPATGKMLTHFQSEFGRLRAVTAHNSSLYISTSNRDGRGRVREEDDRIMQVKIT